MKPGFIKGETLSNLLPLNLSLSLQNSALFKLCSG